MIRDVLGPNLTALFVGFNPGTRSGETGRHYAGRNNRFWQLLHEAGLFGARLDPVQDRLVLARGYGLTNIVARTTPSSSDLRREDYREGAVELRRKVDRCAPRIMVYMGKGVYAALHGVDSARINYGLQPFREFPGSADFVAPSPSGRATIPYRDKLAIMLDLAALVREAEARLAEAWQSGFATSVVDHALGLAPGDRLLILSGRPREEVADPLTRRATENGVPWALHALDVRRPGEALARGDRAASDGRQDARDAVVIAPSQRDWISPAVQSFLKLPAGPLWRARAVLLPPLPAQSLHRSLSMPYRSHIAFCDRLMLTVRNATQLRIRSGQGTDLKVRTEQFAVQSFASRTAGEFMFGVPGMITARVIAGSAQGRLVIDGATHHGLLSERLILDLAEGKIVACARSGRPDGATCGPDPLVDRFLAEAEVLASRQPEALLLDRLGIGANAASRVSGCIAEDETVLGACYVGFGATPGPGGQPLGISAVRGAGSLACRLGGMISEPSISIDGVTLVSEGLLVERNLV